jgi:hypothetical protein
MTIFMDIFSCYMSLIIFGGIDMINQGLENEKLIDGNLI